MLYIIFSICLISLHLQSRNNSILFSMMQKSQQQVSVKDIVQFLPKRFGLFAFINNELITEMTSQNVTRCHQVVNYNKMTLYCVFNIIQFKIIFYFYQNFTSLFCINNLQHLKLENIKSHAQSEEFLMVTDEILMLHLYDYGFAFVITFMASLFVNIAVLTPFFCRMYIIVFLKRIYLINDICFNNLN